MRTIFQHTLSNGLRNALTDDFFSYYLYPTTSV